MQILCKVVVTPGSHPAVSAHLFGCLEVLASPATEQQAVAVCEGVLAVKPPVLPWMLKQLEQPSGAGVVAAVLGKLHWGYQDCRMAEFRTSACPHSRATAATGAGFRGNCGGEASATQQGL
jgi:hypothetical protein